MSRHEDPEHCTCPYCLGKLETGEPERDLQTCQMCCGTCELNDYECPYCAGEGVR